jgi:osmotically-inducible protein OsmY
MPHPDQLITPAGETNPVAAGTVPETGKIVLSGQVTTAEEKEEIEQAVRASMGVTYVENHIQVAEQSVY